MWFHGREPAKRSADSFSCFERSSQYAGLSDSAGDRNTEITLMFELLLDALPEVQMVLEQWWWDEPPYVYMSLI
jgi:hypothetical protein